MPPIQLFYFFNGDFGGVGNGYGFIKQEKPEEPVQQAAPEITPEFVDPDKVMDILDRSVNAFVPQQPALQVNLSEDVIARVQKSMEEFMLTREIVEQDFGKNADDIMAVLAELK